MTSLSAVVKSFTTTIILSAREKTLPFGHLVVGVGEISVACMSSMVLKSKRNGSGDGSCKHGVEK